MDKDKEGWKVKNYKLTAVIFSMVVGGLIISMLISVNKYMSSYEIETCFHLCKINPSSILDADYFVACPFAMVFISLTLSIGFIIGYIIYWIIICIFPQYDFLSGRRIWVNRIVCLTNTIISFLNISSLTSSIFFLFYYSLSSKLSRKSITFYTADVVTSCQNNSRGHCGPLIYLFLGSIFQLVVLSLSITDLSTWFTIPRPYVGIQDIGDLMSDCDIEDFDLDDLKAKE